MVAGAGRISERAALCFEQGMRAPLIVTDPGLATLPMLQEISELLTSEGITKTIFSEITANPSELCIEKGCVPMDWAGVVLIWN